MAIGIEVPFHRPSIGHEEIEEVVRTLQSGWLTTGPRTARFEREFRDYVQAPHSLGVSSCTAGLHLALAALGIGPGDEVITTPLTFCATVNVILHAGATPVLADVGEDGNIDPASVAARIGERTKAVIPVHLAGLPCDMDALWELARRHKLHVIEDAAHAAGAFYRGHPIGAGNPETGARSDAVAFSFYATKNLTTGEGGMVTTHDAALAGAMRLLCLQGIGKDAWSRNADSGKWFYQVLVPGFKYNLSDIQSAIGIHQLRKLEAFAQLRTRYAALYNHLLANCEEFDLPRDRPDSRHAWHLYRLRLNLDKLNCTRDEFIAELGRRGIGAGVHFIPIPLHPFFAPFAGRPENFCPRALALYPRLVSLPLYPAMTEAEVDYVAQSAREVAMKFRKSGPVCLHSNFIPGLADLIEERHLARQIRDVDVEDLLGRVAISTDQSALRAKLERKVVFVTGAAGSIGSEICRQVARFHPASIVGFDVAETPLFNLEQEMRASFPGVEFHPEIGCIRDRAGLAEVLGRHEPSILYHAAAYKHVPMMESNLFVAVQNNILGTANVVAAALECGVADFVMISSDKAVRPTNIMGLTKRVAELLIGSVQDSRTKFVSVRFGNVLGSNGSVIPIFKKQIAAGGPVTVTHPEMRRYFMTIPEAVQLVLQASTMGKGGEIFVLDMGQPVKIVDLARNLILLSGLRPGEDIRIEFTGVRPGEKLYEELSTMDENTAPTVHEKIKVFTGPALSSEEMDNRLSAIRRLLEARDGRGLLLELKDLVVGQAVASR